MNAHTPNETLSDEQRIWHVSLVPIFGILWLLLPACIWLLDFGGELTRTVMGSAGRGVIPWLVGIPLGAWGISGGIFLRREVSPLYRTGRAGQAGGAARAARFGIAHAVALAGALAFAVLLAPRLGLLVIPSGFGLGGFLFIGGSLLKIGGPTARLGLSITIHLLVGSAFLFLLGPGIVPVIWPPPHALLGAAVLILAWIGWTGLTSPTRRLALASLRRLRSVRRG